MYQSKNVSLFELAEGKDSKERDLHSLLTVYFTRVLKNHGENSNIKIFVYLNAVDHTKKVYARSQGWHIRPISKNSLLLRWWRSSVQFSRMVSSNGMFSNRTKVVIETQFMTNYDISPEIVWLLPSEITYLQLLKIFENKFL